MKKFKIDLSTILFIVLELILVVDIIIAICNGSVSVKSYVMTSVIAMVGFFEAEMMRQRNKKNKK